MHSKAELLCTCKIERTINSVLCTPQHIVQILHTYAPISYENIFYAWKSLMIWKMQRKVWSTILSLWHWFLALFFWPHFLLAIVWMGGGTCITDTCVVSCTCFWWQTVWIEIRKVQHHICNDFDIFFQNDEQGSNI